LVTASKKRSRAAPLLAIAIVVLVAAGCSSSARDDVRFKSDIAAAFPGFHLVEMRYEDLRGGGWPGESGTIARYMFKVQSDDVPTFHIVGPCETASLSYDAGIHDAHFRDNMFNRKSLTREQLGGLERVWASSFPTGDVIAGDGSDTGLWPSKLKGVAASLKGPVYVLQNTVGRLRFFRLDPDSGQWSEVPNKYVW
jgi:hypothetical protein